MSLNLPEGLRWLGWIAGAPWPAGDEDQAWADSRAWGKASTNLAALLAAVDQAKQATGQAYTAGQGADAMAGRYDEIRVGDQSMEALAQHMRTVSDSAFDMGTELQAQKVTIVVTLSWLAAEIAWAWLFPPTAPAVEASAIMSTRSILKIAQDTVQKTIENLARRMKAPVAQTTGHRYFWANLAHGKLVFPTAKGWGVYSARAGEVVAISGAIDGSVQAGQIFDHKRRHFNGKEFGFSMLGGIVGAPAAREFGRYLGHISEHGIEKITRSTGRDLNNRWVRTGRGLIIGSVSDGVGAIAGNVAVGVANVATGGRFADAFNSGPGWVGGFAQGGLVGGARGAFAYDTYIPKTTDGYTVADRAAFRRNNLRAHLWWFTKDSAKGFFAVHESPTGGGHSAQSDGSAHGRPASGAGSGGAGERRDASAPTDQTGSVAGTTRAPTVAADIQRSELPRLVTELGAPGSSGAPATGGRGSSEAAVRVGESGSPGTDRPSWFDPNEWYAHEAGGPGGAGTAVAGGAVGGDRLSWFDSAAWYAGEPPAAAPMPTGPTDVVAVPPRSPVSPAEVPLPDVADTPPLSNSVQWSAVPLPPDPTLTRGTDLTDAGGTQANLAVQNADNDEPFLGEGKDLRGKPRPSRWPVWQSLPPTDYRPPAPPGGSWLPDGAVAAPIDPPGSTPSSTAPPVEPGRPVPVPVIPAHPGEVPLVPSRPGVEPDAPGEVPVAPFRPGAVPRGPDDLVPTRPGVVPSGAGSPGQVPVVPAVPAVVPGSSSHPGQAPSAPSRPLIVPGLSTSPGGGGSTSVPGEPFEVPSRPGVIPAALASHDESSVVSRAGPVTIASARRGDVAHSAGESSAQARDDAPGARDYDPAVIDVPFTMHRAVGAEGAGAQR